MRLVPGRQDDEHVQRAAVQQEEYGSRGALLLRWLLQAVLYLCSWPSARAQSAPKRRFGGRRRDTATTEARSIDSDRFAESKSTAHQWVVTRLSNPCECYVPPTNWKTSRDY